jgi:hypothetical protein
MLRHLRYFTSNSLLKERMGLRYCQLYFDYAIHSRNVLLIFASTVILGFGADGSFEHLFLLSRPTYMFRNGVSSSTRGEGDLLIGATVIVVSC